MALLFLVSLIKVAGAEVFIRYVTPKSHFLVAERTAGPLVSGGGKCLDGLTEKILDSNRVLFGQRWPWSMFWRAGQGQR